MWTTVLFSALLFTSAEAQVTLLSGDQTSGTITAISTKAITLHSDQGDTEHPLNKIQAVVFPQNPLAPPKAGVISITFYDGTILYATKVALTDAEVQIVLVGDHSLDIRADSIKDIRFKTLSGEALQQYETIIGNNAAEDILMIQRTSGAIDQLEGIIESIDDEFVTFNFDGEKIPVEIKKLAGVRLLRPADRELSATVCKITDTRNNVFFVSDLSLEPTGRMMNIKLSTGDSINLEMDMVHRMDFSNNNVLYLSDLKPESVQWKPFLTGNLIRDRLARVYRPRHDTSLDGSPIVIGVESYRKGFSLHSRTVMALRLPEAYSKLQMDIGIDPSMNGRGHVELIILGDNKQLFRDFVSGTDAPRSLDINITGIRRITITVDYGKNLDIGDQLNLGNARVLK